MAVDEQYAQALRDLAEADRRAGEAERLLANERDTTARRQDWLRAAKKEAGYHDNVSFDTVWADTLAAAQAFKGERIEPIGGDVLPPMASRVLIHLGREDKWVEHVVVGYYVWPPLGSSGLRVFVRVRHPGGSLNARLLKDVRKLDGTPFLPEPAPGVSPSDGEVKRCHPPMGDN